jgi:hypothetical protein
MTRYVIQTKETKNMKRIVKKYGSVRIQNDKMDGVIQIVGYRKYNFHEEVDVTFTGKMNVSIGWGKEWVPFEKYAEIIERISHRRLNRLVRHILYWEAKEFLLIFGVRLTTASEIKKITWVG